ncbi:MAG TPA: hypothetical protein VM324_12910, partial [Egibacteraceae bacterium]|nr:hypothetical protein [Egibacteraceae bacterium]
TTGRELVRQMFQDHLDVRAQRETRVEVTDVHGATHGAVEAGHVRGLHTVFGEVDVARMAYRRRGHHNLHPADATLNLPAERHSHGLRRLAAVEAARGSFDAAVAAVKRASGQTLGKRQVEGLAARAAADFDDFYAHRLRPGADPDDVLVISCDAKGIVMRPDALRAATAKAAAQTDTKLATRLSKGEKRNRKRMATVASVYELTPAPRTPADVLPDTGDTRQRAPAPTAKNKWLMASVADDAASVVGRMFDEAQRRDPGHTHKWIALVDGNNHQIDRIKIEAGKRGVTVSIVVDFVHVLEYLWGAAWSFFTEGDPDAEPWVRDKAHAVLWFAPADSSSRTAWTSPAPAGASRAPKPSSNCAPCSATVTSTPTETCTWPENTNVSTSHATPTAPSHRPHNVPPGEPHPGMKFGSANTAGSR